MKDLICIIIYSFHTKNVKTSLTQFPVQNVWSVPCRFSGLNPPSAAAGDPPGDPPLKPLTLPTKTLPFHHKTFQPYPMQNLFQGP